MTEQQLKEAIVAQAVRIAELERKLELSEWMRDTYQKEVQKMEKQVAEADGIYKAIGLTD